MGDILLVEDEVLISLVLARAFEGEGHTVRTARDGREALTQVRERAPDIVVTDLQMPVMNGLELAMNLRASAETREIPVLMLTARGYIADESLLSKTNIREMISKPFSARRVVERAAELLREGTPERRVA